MTLLSPGLYAFRDMNKKCTRGSLCLIFSCLQTIHSKNHHQPFQHKVYTLDYTFTAGLTGWFSGQKAEIAVALHCSLAPKKGLSTAAILLPRTPRTHVKWVTVRFIRCEIKQEKIYLLSVI